MASFHFFELNKLREESVMVSNQYAPLPEGWQCKGLVMHFAPHFDEILATWIFYYFDHVGQKYPGASRAEHRVRNEREEIRNGEEVLLRDGYIPLGWGNGRFCEHPDPTAGIVRKDNHCCATLVAEDLGVRDHPYLKGILDYALHDDMKGGQDKRHIPYVIQVFHRQNMEYRIVMQWTFDAIHAKYVDVYRGGSSGDDWSIETIAKLIESQYPNDQGRAEAWLTLGADALTEQDRRFREVTPIEYKKKAKVTPFNWIDRRGKSHTLTIVSAKTDDDQFGSYARSKVGGGAAVVIIQNSRKQVQILLNKYYQKFGLTLDDVTKLIRLNEQKAHGRVAKSDFLKVRLEGMLESDDRWHYFTEGQVLLNGGFTAPHVKPTQLAFDRIVKIVHSVLDQSVQ